MATRSHIGRLNLDGTVDFIYCHWDGYPTGNGVTLIEHYTTIDKVNQLLELGDLSVLNKEIGEKQDFDDTNTHNGNWCLAYGRDRGESNVSKRNTTLSKFIENKDVDYAYMFDGDYWECYKTSSGEIINLYKLEEVN